MKPSFSFLLLSFLVFSVTSFSQKIEVLTSGTKTSIRGLSVVNENIIWASGSGGKVARSTNGGKSFEWITVKGFEKNDFRDIEAFDSNTAVIMAVADPAYILKTTNGGKDWKVVYSNSTKGMFLDAMNFYDSKHGMVIGDPINDTVFQAVTSDGGDTWQVYTKYPVKVDAGEAFFASSGTNLKYFMGSYVLVSGGTKASFIFPETKLKLDILQGKESTGCNSVAYWKGRWVIVGGDFANDKDTTLNCLYSLPGPPRFRRPATPPHGYRSCVAFISKKKLITCGTSGIDISTDGGNNWKLISNESYHVCQKAKKGKAVFLAGGNGRISKLIE